jgi:hypothetical protein
VVADLRTNKRADLPSSDFGLPEKARTKEDKKRGGNYPMPDAAHARNAKSRAAQQERAGNLTKAERKRIDRKADAILGADTGPATAKGKAKAKAKGKGKAEAKGKGKAEGKGKAKGKAKPKGKAGGKRGTKRA